MEISQGPETVSVFAATSAGGTIPTTFAYSPFTQDPKDGRGNSNYIFSSYIHMIIWAKVRGLFQLFFVTL